MNTNNSLVRLQRCANTITAVALIAFSAAASGADPLPPPGTYQIKDGRVDIGTFLGWRVFHSTCFSCHGLDAEGTSIAPNLVQSVRGMTPRAFATKVLTRYRLVVPATEGESPEAFRDAIIEEVLKQERGKRGEITMPAWESDLRVKPHVLDLYAYLSARAHGLLPPGRPKLKAEK
jgi:mono/diheme cytochrome c family protein